MNNVTNRRTKKNKNPKTVLIPIIGIVILIFFISVVVYNITKVDVVLADNLCAEQFTDVYCRDYIKEIKNGEMVSDDQLVNTENPGESITPVKVKGNFGIEVYELKVNIEESTKIFINGPDEIPVSCGENINYDAIFQVSGSANIIKNKGMEGSVENSVGNYQCKYVVEKTNGEKIEKPFTVRVFDSDITVIRHNDNNGRNTSQEDDTFTTKNGKTGHKYNGVTYIEDTLIVNKTYSLPESYGNGLTTDTVNAFNMMKNDAAALGHNLWIASGFRSYRNQSSLYNEYCRMDGQVNADTYSARPGYSEHQSGLAIDLNNIDNSFGNSPAGKWVLNNCYKYGFIHRYPESKQNITGYSYESWHLRYVGVGLAEKLYNSGDWITLEEYFGIDSSF